MISFGFITVHQGQEISYITEIASRSQVYGIDIYRFTPTSIDPISENVHGYLYNHEKQLWEKAIFPIPEYLYDRCFYGNNDASKRAQPIMNWLKSRPNTTFLGHGLPNKWEIYQALKQDIDLSYYLPHTEEVTSSTKVLRKLLKNQTVLLKPTSGSMGKGVIGLFLTKGKIEMVTHRDKKRVTEVFSKKQEILQWLDSLLETKPYLLQTLLDLKDESNHPFDIRILLQKNENGAWAELGRGIRKGHRDSIISNISGGAEIIPFPAWVENVPAKEKLLLIENINTIIDKIPVLLESRFQRMFEIGIDLGFAQDGSVWILDTNSKPGRKVVFSSNEVSEDDIYSGPLRYCKFLAEKSLKVKRS